MRRLASFVKKYGPVIGPLLLSKLQRVSAYASHAARFKKKHGIA